MPENIDTIKGFQVEGKSVKYDYTALANLPTTHPLQIGDQIYDGSSEVDATEEIVKMIEEEVKNITIEGVDEEVIAAAIRNHNSSESAHEDIRSSFSDLEKRFDDLEIPTGDISSQIKEHDESVSAHRNLFEAIQIPTKVSELTNDAGYLTEIPSTYITETELDQKGYLTSIPSEYITETELGNKNYLTKVPNEYITETELNDKGYLTKVPEGYAKTENLGALASKNIVESSDLASDIQNSLNKANTALQSYSETDPNVPSWAKQPNKPTYTAQEVGALPSTTIIPTALSDLSTDSEHRTVTDIEKQNWDAKSNFSGDYNDLINRPTIPNDDYINGLIDNKLASFANAEEVLF